MFGHLIIHLYMTTGHLIYGIPLLLPRLCKLKGRVDYRSGCIRTHYVGGRSTWSFQLSVRVLSQITHRNELICSFNTFCTCIRPTRRLMSGISLLLVREYALVCERSLSTRPGSPLPDTRWSGTFAKHHVHNLSFQAFGTCFSPNNVQNMN